MSKVSICIPVYNRDELIKKALESSMNQTYSDIEIVVCDNCSTDRTKEVVLEYAKKDSRIKFFENEENIGALRNFKKTIELATGDFVVLLGSDDWLSEDFIESRMKGFKLFPDAAFISGPMTTNTIFDDNTYKKNIDYIYNSSKLSKEYVYKNFYKKFLISYFCLFRKDDILNNFATDFENEMNWEIYKTGYGLDLINCLNILKKYDYMYYIGSGVYNFGNPSDRESESIVNDNMNINEPITKLIEDYIYVTYLFNEYYKSLELDYIAKEFVNYKFLQLMYELLKSRILFHKNILVFINIMNVSKLSIFLTVLKMPFYIFYRLYRFNIRKKYGVERN
ncbi:glycosyltransferase family 2 protein [Sulfurimonas sp.]|uniref:glycosyltransferase family 2 protein n=1 Tax=Sulfurimonas sp. TaxID=2022749 RepID=UPI003568FB56